MYVNMTVNSACIVLILNQYMYTVYTLPFMTPPTPTPTPTEEELEEAVLCTDRDGIGLLQEYR